MLKTNFFHIELYNLFVSKTTAKQGKASLTREEASLGLAKVKFQSSKRGCRREFKILLWLLPAETSAKK